MRNVYVVTVSGRMDGVYCFEGSEDAQEFCDAVRTWGGNAAYSVDPLNDHDSTRTLIAVEADV